MPHEDIEAEDVPRAIRNVSESAPGPDGVKYSDLMTLNDQDLHRLTYQVNQSIADQISQKSG